MAKKPEQNPAENEFDQEILKTLSELGITHKDWKNISAADILYLINRYPFLQIIDTSPKITDNLPPLKLLTSRSGWQIHNYGHAMSSSPGLLMFGGGDFRIKSDSDDKGGEGGGGILNPGKGTIINQAVNTAFEMAELVQQLGWSGIKIVDGHQLMVWGLWMQAMDMGMEIEGFTPTAQDLAKRKRVKRSRTEQEILRYPSGPG